MAIDKTLIDQLLKDYKRPEEIIGENGLLKQLTKAVLERALEAEMNDHLGYEKHDPAGHHQGNPRATGCGAGCDSCRSTTVCKTTPPPPPPRLGGLCEGCFRRSHAGVALFRSLHASRGHFQSPLINLRSRARHFPLEGLCSRRQAKPDDTDSDGVLAPLLSPYPA